MKYILLLSFAGLIIACGGGPSATHYAKKFCSCSEELGKATIQLQTKRIDQAAFDKVLAEQETCMGKTDPLKQIENDQERLKFQADFLEAIFEKCPNVARNMGFKE